MGRRGALTPSNFDNNPPPSPFPARVVLLRVLCALVSLAALAVQPQCYGIWIPSGECPVPIYASVMVIINIIICFMIILSPSRITLHSVRVSKETHPQTSALDSSFDSVVATAR